MSNEIIQQLQQSLVTFLPDRRWFAQKDRTIEYVSFRDWTSASFDGCQILPTIIDVGLDCGTTSTYFFPIVLSRERKQSQAATLISSLSVEEESLFAYDALTVSEFGEWLRTNFLTGSEVATEQGAMSFHCTDAGAMRNAGLAHPVWLEQSNSTLFFGEDLIVKIYRQFQFGPNPEIELGRAFLDTENRSVAPALVGWIEYASRGQVGAIGVVQEFVRTGKNLWLETVDRLEHNVLPVIGADIGQLTARMHLALLDTALPADMQQEPISQNDIDIWETSARESITSLGASLDSSRDDLPAEIGELASTFAASRVTIDHKIEGFQHLLGYPKCRVHGDFHLGQILVCDDGSLVAIDFEGEPARSIDERRVKFSPMKDLAGILRSLAYASAFGDAKTGKSQNDPVALSWQNSQSEELLAAYTDTLSDAGVAIGPERFSEFQAALHAWEIDKAVYEAQYELANRPDWLKIPLLALLQDS